MIDFIQVNSYTKPKVFNNILLGKRSKLPNFSFASKPSLSDERSKVQILPGKKFTDKKQWGKEKFAIPGDSTKLFEVSRNFAETSCFRKKRRTATVEENETSQKNKDFDNIVLEIQKLIFREKFLIAFI